MRKFLLFLCCFLCIWGAQGQKLSALFNYGTFATAKGDSYIETYLSVQGSSLKFVKNTNGKYQAKVNVKVLFMDPYANEDVLAFMKYNLVSPEVDKPEDGVMVMLDQQRKVLEPGDYSMVIEIMDANDSLSQPVNAKSAINIPNYTKLIDISSIQLVEEFNPTVSGSVMNKYGYNMPPRLDRFYADTDSVMCFCAEVYNTGRALGKGRELLLRTYITTLEGGVPPNAFSYHEKVKSDDIIVVAKRFSLNDLETGNYLLNIELLNQQGVVINKSQLAFQRFKGIDDINANQMNPEMDLSKVEWKELLLFVKSLAPIANSIELPYIEYRAQGDSKEGLMKFFWTFWEQRNYEDPVGEWAAYYKLVREAEELFGLPHQKGFQTDRGVIYIKYGKPTVRRGSEGDFLASPYEIWYYDNSRSQNQIKFVFCSSNDILDYQLIHSNAKGETYDTEWVTKIYGKSDNFKSMKNKTDNMSDDALKQQRSSTLYDKYKALEIYNSPL